MDATQLGPINRMTIRLAQPAKHLVARSFGAAAATYDAVAGLQRSVGEALLGQAPGPAGIVRVIDVGAGTGYFAVALAQRYPAAQVIALDIAEAMLEQSRTRFSGACVAGDAESLPFATASADLIFSNLAIQWCGCPERTFREFGRVLRPGGTLLFATFGPMTLQELRLAWAEVDPYTHVNDFVNLARLQGALGAAGLTGPKVASLIRRIDYPDVLALMRELKGLGARNLTPLRPRHLLGKGALAKMLAAYPTTDRRQADASISATFEVITGNVIRNYTTDYYE